MEQLAFRISLFRLRRVESDLAKVTRQLTEQKKRLKTYQGQMSVAENNLTVATKGYAMATARAKEVLRVTELPEITETKQQLMHTMAMAKQNKANNLNRVGYDKKGIVEELERTSLACKEMSRSVRLRGTDMRIDP